MWLQKPYYPLPEPQVYVDTTVKNWPPSIKTKTLTIECYLQSVLYSTMSNISGYLNPNYNTFLPARTAQAVIDDFIATAFSRVLWYPSTGEGVDAMALGMQYGKLMVALMQDINSGGMTGGIDGVSLWDAWVTMTAPIK